MSTTPSAGCVTPGCLMSSSDHGGPCVISPRKEREVLESWKAQSRAARLVSYPRLRNKGLPGK
jgi:hypothetical protein